MPLKEFQKELKDHVSKDNLSETLEAIIKSKMKSHQKIIILEEIKYLKQFYH
jgi:hypothetical protein